jgi:3-phosphoshikimate 1-carboxyvinyltransferase
MKRELKPARKFGGTIQVPGDKSIGHRAALFSIIAKEPITVHNFPNGQDCQSSLAAAKALGVTVMESDGSIKLTPPAKLNSGQAVSIDCGNSGTTARLIAGILSGSQIEATLTGDESLSRRPMKRIIDPLTKMGADLYATEGHLPMTVRGKKLLPFEYHLPVASAQVKSALLLAGIASSCSVTIREDSITRDHTEVMLAALGEGITINTPKPVRVPDPNDPRKTILEKAESFKKEVKISGGAKIMGGEVHIPGDISTAAFFFAVGALSNKSVTIENVGLNPTRVQFLDYLKAIGCNVEITNKQNQSGEPRGTVTVSGDQLKAKKISGESTVGLIDEIPIVSVLAAFSEGTTVIRDASELKVKESDRLAAIAHNLTKMGVKCGLLEDGLIIEGAGELEGADFVSFGDHRIAMAFSIAALFCTGPSTIDDADCVAISCPTFYDLLKEVAR